MQIAFVLTDQMLSTSVSWPIEMWTSANHVSSSKRTNKQDKRTPVSLQTVACQKNTISCHAGLKFFPDKILDKKQKFDLIYLPALWRNPKPIVRRSRPIIEWLQRQYENGAIICSVGTGSCFVAETGLLDHKPATTHWYYFDKFSQQYPTIELKRQHFITEAGKLYCAASINSLADLTVHFIQRYYGKAIAQHVERHFSHEIRQQYTAINYAERQNTNHPDELILQIQMWIQDNFANDIIFKETATQFGMSERNFSRRFKSATGQTPNQFLQALRINNAKDLLQYSNLGVGEIADRVGYSDMSYFAKKFKHYLSVSPREYRATVRAKLFNVNKV